MSALEQVTVNGIPEGSNLAEPPHEILDTQARYLQDVMLDELGLVRRRGVVTPVNGVVTFDDFVVGICQATNPANVHKVGVLHGTSSFSVTSDDYSSKTTLTWPGTFTTSPYTIVDAKTALGGGTMIGATAQAGQAPRQLAYWRGGERVDSSTGTISVIRGSKSVTGSGTGWTVTCSPGMFLFGTADNPDGVMVYLGVVQSVTDDTHLVLEEPSLFNVTADTYQLKALRGVFPRYRFRATTEITTRVLTGQSSKFVSNQLDANWFVFRASDNAFVGQIDAVSTDTVANLVTNSAVAMEVEECFAIRTDNGWSISSPRMGSLTAVYAERQWYCDGINAFFSEADDFEAVDMDPIAGNFVEVASTKVGASSRPINACVSAGGSLLFLKENETFHLVGNAPTTFELRKLMDDGALSGMSVQQYQGGVLYAGREGIYFYDGVETKNIVHDRLGDYYKALVRTFDPTTHRMWSLLTRDCYKVFIESVTPTYGPTKGLVINKPTRMTISVYLPTRAVTFHTNLDIRGSIEMPAATGRGVWYLVNQGETIAAPVSALTASRAGFAPTGFPPGTYRFAVAFTIGGVTGPVGPLSTALTWAPGEPLGGDTQNITFAGIPTGPTGTTARHIYVSVNGGPLQELLDPAASLWAENLTTGATISSVPLGGAPHGLPGGRICSTIDLFETTGTDTIACTGNRFGPDFYIESKRYGLGDDLRKKLFKQLVMHYYVGGDDLLMDTVIGLNENGTTSLSRWIKSVLAWDAVPPVASTWDRLVGQYAAWDDLGQPRFAVKRIKFLKRTHQLGFRLYQASPEVTQIKLGPWALGFKLQRVGRV